MNLDPTVELITQGVTAAAMLLSGDKSLHEQGRVAWAEFERDVRSGQYDDVRLANLVQNFSLDTFEFQVLMIGMATHIEPRTPTLVAGSRSAFVRSITVRLILESLSRDSREALNRRPVFLPTGKLVRNRLITLEDGVDGPMRGLLARTVTASASALRYILSEEELSETTGRIARLELPDVSLLNVILPRDHMEQVRELIEHHHRYRELITTWGFDKVLPYGRGLTLLFSGPSGTGKTLLAQAMASHMKVPLLSLAASDLPEKEGVDQILTELFSEATMRGALVLIDECESLLGKADKRKASAFKAIEAFDGVLVLTTNHPERLDEALDRRIIYSLPFEMPDPPLRQQIWEVHLPPEVPLSSDIDLDVLATRYDFTGGTIKNAILVAVNRAIARNASDPRVTFGDLDEGCRTQLKYALEELTTRTTTHMRLKDIVLPDETMKKVKEIVSAIRNQSIVLNTWGFGRKLVTGKGIISLFDGPPGTGKTFCAEIIAGEFDRPLYRVNLPEVVSKWVGETEKHIKQIFEQARISHAMLLFDEADALFASRSAEVKSATDRHANMEVNLLLQEIERFPGVCILTTNFYGALDRALTRRIQFRVTFEEPDAEQRARIWKTLIPGSVPMGENVDFASLGEDWELTGGRIKNALLRAAYAAADGGGRLTQKVLEEACLEEYKAAGRVSRDPNFKPPESDYVDPSELPLMAHQALADTAAAAGQQGAPAKRPPAGSGRSSKGDASKRRSRSAKVRRAGGDAS